MRVKIGMEGADAGPMAGILAKMGNIEVQTLVESVETTPLADDLFAPPAGYKLNTSSRASCGRNGERSAVSVLSSLSSFLNLLRTSDGPVVTVELRPPRAELESYRRDRRVD